MSAPRLPFIEYDGRAYLVVNFDLPPHDLPSLPNLLAALLAHHHADEVLLLRPLTHAETELLHERQRDSEVEGWAQLIVKIEDRFRGRDHEE